MKHMFAFFGLLILAAVGVSWAQTTPTTPTIRQILVECPDWDHGMACPSAVREFLAARTPPTDQTDRQIGSLAVQLVGRLEGRSNIPLDVCMDVAAGINILSKAMKSPGQTRALEHIALDLCDGSSQTATINPPGNGNGGNGNGGNENGGTGNENGGNGNGGNENGGTGNENGGNGNGGESSSTPPDESSSSSTPPDVSSSSSAPPDESSSSSTPPDESSSSSTPPDDSSSSAPPDDGDKCPDGSDKGDDGNCGNGNDPDRCDGGNGPGCDSSSSAPPEPFVCDEGKREEDGKCVKDDKEDKEDKPKKD